MNDHRSQSHGRVKSGASESAVESWITRPRTEPSPNPHPINLDNVIVAGIYKPLKLLSGQRAAIDHTSSSLPQVMAQVIASDSHLWNKAECNGVQGRLDKLALALRNKVVEEAKANGVSGPNDKCKVEIFVRVAHAAYEDIVTQKRLAKSQRRRQRRNRA